MQEWLNYHHLFYFSKVAKLGSFTKAAQELSISQSAVSTQVAQLELFLGEKLIVRQTSRELKLTEAGQMVLEQAEEIFNQGRLLVDQFRGSQQMRLLRIGTTGRLSKNLQVLVLNQVLRNETVQTVIAISDPETLLQKLRRFQLDLILSDDTYHSTQDLPLIQKEIASEPYCIALRSKSAEWPQVLQTQGIYLPSKNHPATAEIETFFSTKGWTYRVRGYIDDIAMLRLLGLETESCIAIPRVGLRREISNREILVLHEFKKIKQRFYLITRSGSRNFSNLSQLMGL